MWVTGARRCVVILLAVHVVVLPSCLAPRASGTDHAWILGEQCSLTLAGLLFCWIALFVLAFSSWRGVSSLGFVAAYAADRTL